MAALNNKLVLIFTTLMIITGWGGWWLLNNVFQLKNIELYPVIPAFFFVMGTSVINVITHINRSDGRKVLNFYMVLKLMKFVLSAVLVAILYIYARENSKILLLTFACFYLIYIFCEVYFYSQVEKADKAKKKHE